MKKLLILGAYYTEIEIIERAKALGCYTIVTDNHENPMQSPAKQVADEAWNISWTDIDELCKKCVECQVNGVIAGFSEFRVENMIRICDRLNLPCSLTMHQLDITRNKNKFKRTCEYYGIPCVPEHQYNDNFGFPVIVKPVDRASSVGISVAYNREDFETAYQYAMSMSNSKSVIIEDFISNGTKVDVYYYVKDGGISLLGTSDTIMCHDSGVMQKAWPFPSKWERQYVEEIDEKVRNMIKGIGIENAYLTISAFYTKGHFYIFETGFRLSGEMSFNYYKIFTGVDYVEEMIRFALGEKSDVQFVEHSGTVPNSIILNFFAQDGIIKKIYNIDAISAIPEVIDFLVYGQEGEEIHNKGSLLKKIAMCTICATDWERIIDVVDQVNQLFSVMSTNDKEMINEKVERDEL